METKIACRFADSRATSPISSFDTESIEKIQEIISFIEQSEDTYFIFALAKENIGRGITEYYAPHVFVVDIAREDHPLHSIGFDDSKFCIKDIEDYILMISSSARTAESISSSVNKTKSGSAITAWIIRNAVSVAVTKDAIRESER